MVKFGWFFIIAYGVDAVVSLIATIAPAAESISDAISSVVILLSIVVFILACIGKLRPRKIFIILTCFGFLMIAFGIMLAVLLAIKMGPSIASQEITVKLLWEQFAWYGSAHWTFIILDLFVSAYGIQAYWRARTAAEKEPEKNPSQLGS